MEARVTAYSQADRLRERMAQAEVQHGQEIRTDLAGIGVISMARDWFTARHRGKGEIFFCNMGPIQVREVTVPGDGGALPSDVVVEGLEVASGGSYDLLNVLVQSNGDLRLIVDDATRVVPVIREREIGRVATRHSCAPRHQDAGFPWPESSAPSSHWRGCTVSVSIAEMRPEQ